jgi:hypothetical protein
VFVKEEQTDASFQFHLPVDSLSCQVSLYGSFCGSGSGSRFKPRFLLSKRKHTVEKKIILLKIMKDVSA